MKTVSSFRMTANKLQGQTVPDWNLPKKITSHMASSMQLREEMNFLICYESRPKRKAIHYKKCCQFKGSFMMKIFVRSEFESGMCIRNK